MLIPSDLKFSTSRARPSRSSRGSCASAAPPRLCKYRGLLYPVSQRRTWLVGNTTNVETLIAGEEGIALDGDGWQVSLGLTGDDAGKGGSNSGSQDGEDDTGLHDGRRRRSRIKRQIEERLEV